MKNLLMTLHKDESGATATEYIILLVLVACFVIAIVALFGEEIQKLFVEAQQEVMKVKIQHGGSGTFTGSVD